MTAMTRNLSLMTAVTTCPVCANTRVRIRTTVGEHNVWQCEGCGLYWVPGVTEAELAGFYEEHYYQSSQEFGYADYLNSERIQRANARRLLRLIASHSGGKTGNHLIDVGCAHGFLVDEACKAGWAAEGVDCSTAATMYATEVLHRNVRLGLLDRDHYSHDHFDAVTSVGSIEHMADPMAFVANSARVLKKGGVLVITTLDTKSVIRMFRFKPPEHLFYFSRHNLRRLLESSGFKIEYLKPYISYHDPGEAAGLLLNCLFDARFTASATGLLSRMNLQVLLPNNEMCVVARRT